MQKCDKSRIKMDKGLLLIEEILDIMNNFTFNDQKTIIFYIYIC
jgi:hypothetical protein